VKIVRLLLTLVVVILVLAALAVVLAIAPVVQTAVAQHELAGDGRFKGTVDSVSAGFGEVDLDNLHLESNGAVLTLPSLKAKLGLTRAVVLRDVRVTQLIAAGWTLDLSAVPGADSPQKAAMVLTGMLTQARLPVTSSWDDVELEGDVILAGVGGGAPAKMHLVLNGGGLAPGHEGSYTLEASGVTPWSAEAAISAHGTLVLAMDSARHLRRIAVNLVLSGTSSTHKDDLTLTAGTSRDPGSGEDTYTVDLAQGARHLVSVEAHLAKGAGQVAGTWKADLHDADLAQALPSVHFPAFQASGQGRFDADATFARLHVQGEAQGSANHLGVIAAPLENLGPVGLHARFEGVRDGTRVRFERLEVAVANSRPVVAVRSVQPFSFDVSTPALAVADPAKDWLEATVPGLPFAWLASLTGATVASGPDLAGDFTVRYAAGTVSLRSQGPLLAYGVRLHLPGLAEGEAVDLALPVAADLGPAGWKLESKPLVLSRDGHPLATLAGSASSPWGDGPTLTLAGSGAASLGLLVTPARLAVLAPFAGTPVTGDFTVTLAPGAATEVEGKFTAAADATHSLSGSVHADLDGAGGVSVQAPLKLTTGTSVSDFALEGSWTARAEGPQLDLTLTGGSVSLEHLRLLAGAALARPIGAGGRDAQAFWAGTTGRVAVSLDRLRTGDAEYVFVGAIFNLEPGAIRMTSGHGGPEQHSLTNVEATLTFDSAVPAPYHLTTSASAFDVEGKDLFPAKPGDNPVIEGHLKVEGSLAGDGTTLDDLFLHTRERLKLTSTTGIVHLLKVDVADALPQANTPVTDTLGTVGSAFTAVLGSKKEFGEKVKLSKNADAVLDFTNQVAEIGCDQMTVTATRFPDGAVQLDSIEMQASDEFLRGTGTIGAGTRPLAQRPVSLNLTYGARGPLAKLLTTATLGAPAKDAQGFTVLKEPIHLGGTFEHLDTKEWHDLLAKAATAPPPPAPAKKPASP